MTRSGSPITTSASTARAAVPVLAAQAIERNLPHPHQHRGGGLPFQHPLRVAEDWATLDHLSGGRVDVGIGRGNQPAEFKGLRRADGRGRAALQRGRSTSSGAPGPRSASPTTGRFWRFPEIEVLPSP